MPIRVLPDDIVNKIAAGEVVERPASAVKELVENALDAGAGSVEVEIAGGGLRALRVADDGRGMAPGEMALALRRHATSKIAAFDDIYAIASYGFRGEALPSIAAVSRLTLTSRPAGADFAWAILCESGRTISEKAAAAGQGTTVTVEDLFASVPARRKFLKSEQNETRRVTDEVTAQALASPGVAFTLIVDGREALLCRPGAAAVRAADVLGSELFGNMVAFDHGRRPVRAHGFVSRPTHLWPRRREQLIFVNGRRVSDRLVHAAVCQAYGPALQGRHPAYLVFIEISPAQVDVNVHPAKSQVRFRDEPLVFSTIKAGVARAVFSEGDSHFPPSEAAAAYVPAGAAPIGEALASVRELFANPYRPVGPPGPAPGESQPVVAYWQAHNAYILAETKTGIIVIDQHAAHERILYEELLKPGERRRAQQLLFPLTVELTPAELGVFVQHQESFQRLGFDARQFSGRTILVEGLPSEAGAAVDGAAVIRGMLSDLGATGTATDDPVAAIARSFACRAAVKAGQPLSQIEMGRLVDRLFATSSPYLDPHGRPAVIKLSLDDLDRRFGRS